MAILQEAFDPITTSVLASNEYLRDLTLQYKADDIITACLESLGFPAEMVSNWQEVAQIKNYLQKKEK